MASERNRTSELKKYIESLGIKVNLKKNKARGHKGFFQNRSGEYRIDINKTLDDMEILKVLAHEFAHYAHFCYDKNLESLDFFFENFDETILEELLSLTVLMIPKSSIAPLFDKKDILDKALKTLTAELKTIYPDFKLSSTHAKIEKEIKKYNLLYLLKYDRVKILDGFNIKILDINDLELNYPNLSIEAKLYLKLKSKQRHLRKINNRINKLNKYYNSPTELFARAFEFFVINRKLMEEKAPITYKNIEEAILSNRIPILTNFINIYDNYK